MFLRCEAWANKVLGWAASQLSLGVLLFISLLPLWNFVVSTRGPSKQEHGGTSSRPI